MPKLNDLDYGRILSRDEVLIMLSDNMQVLNHKIKYGKIKDKTNAKIKNAQLNSLVYLAQNYLRGLKDKQLDDIQKELIDLKNGSISMDDFHKSIIENAAIDANDKERIDSVIESLI